MLAANEDMLIYSLFIIIIFISKSIWRIVCNTQVNIKNILAVSVIYIKFSSQTLIFLLFLFKARLLYVKNSLKHIEFVIISHLFDFLTVSKSHRIFLF